MKIAVMGAGAMGSVYAGLLTEGGHEVWAVDVWREHVDAIRERGLRVEGASGDRVIKLNATTDPAEPGVCDLVVVATKAAQVGDAAHAAAALIGPDTLVLTIQNGLGAGERICQHMDASRVLLGVAGGFGASMRGPGHVHHNGMQLIRLGEMSGGVSERLENVAQAWCAGGFNVKTFDDIEQLVWEKFVCNVTFSGPCTVLEATIGEIMGNPDAWPISTACAEEAFAAGKPRASTSRSTMQRSTSPNSAKRCRPPGPPCCSTISREGARRSTPSTAWCRWSRVRSARRRRSTRPSLHWSRRRKR